LVALVVVLAAKFTWSLMVMVYRWGSAFRRGNQQKSDMRQVRWPWQGSLLQGRYRTRPTHLAADKAYSSGALRAELRRRKIKAVIPQRSDQQRHHKGRPLVLDKARYRRRNVVEGCFGWLKKFRRFSTRYEKLAGSFAAFIKLAFCLRYLRELLVDRKPAF
jgi:transposase